MDGCRSGFLNAKRWTMTDRVIVDPVGVTRKLDRRRH